MNPHTPLLFAPGYRLHPTRPLVLIPEGTLELRGPAHDILQLIDGTRTPEHILTTLAADYEADAATLRADVLDLLTRLMERGVLQVAP